MTDKVGKEYDRLIKAEILQPAAVSDWVSPAVHVPKPNQSVRVCSDYKALSEAIEDDNYKLPNTQDLLANIRQNGTQPKVFSKLDLTGAFNQLFLDEDSSKLKVFQLQKGSVWVQKQHRLSFKQPWTKFCSEYKMSIAESMTWWWPLKL